MFPSGSRLPSSARRGLHPGPSECPHPRCRRAPVCWATAPPGPRDPCPSRDVGVGSATPAAAASALASLLWSSAAAAAGAVDAAAGPQAAALPVDLATYVPSPLETPSWEIWVGFVAGVVPFVIATYEFSKRIIIQRRCPECRGSGLVQRGHVLRKCTQCGGMLPWLGWKMFLFSSFTAPGNGGPLQQPKGQTSVFYKVPPPPPPASEQSQPYGSAAAEVQQNVDE